MIAGVALVQRWERIIVAPQSDGGMAVSLVHLRPRDCLWAEGSFTADFLYFDVNIQEIGAIGRQWSSGRLHSGD